MRFTATLTLMLGLLAVAACGGGSGGVGDVPGGSGTLPPTSTKGVVRIAVTDAPFPYDYVESAVIRILEIRIRDASAGGGDGGWTTVFDTPTQVDLVPLTGGISQALVDAELEPGTYDDLRILVEPVEVVLKDTATSAIGTHTFTYADGKVHFPSASQSGLKVKFDVPIEVVTQLTTDLTLDFDMSKNFVFNGPIDHAPGVKRVLFTPVCRATNTSTGGAILVTVWSDAGTPSDTSDDGPLSGAGVSVQDAGGTEVASGSTAADGTYTAGGIDAGDGYTVVVTATGHTQPPTAAKSVIAANLTDFGTVLMQGTLEVSGYAFTDNATPADTTDDDTLPGVSVQLYDAGTATAVGTPVVTDANGAYVFTNTGAGPYDVVFTPPAGFAAAVTILNVPGEIQGTGTSRDATLAALTATLTGTVTDTTSGSAVPVPGVLVTVVSTLGFDATASGPLVTDAAGQYSLTVPTGTYTVTFDNAGAVKSTSGVPVVGATTPPVVTVDMAYP